jgi:hypothetical protein
VEDIDPWSNLANLLMCEGVRAAVDNYLRDVIVVVTNLDEDDNSIDYEILGTSFDSRNKVVRIQVQRAEGRRG